MNNFSKVLIAATVFFIYACGANKESSPNSESTLAKDQMEFNAPASPPPPGEEQKSGEAGSVVEKAPAVVFERKLIKTGDVSFKTKSLSETKKQITEALKAAGGYIAKENAYDYSENPSENLTVRVPAKNFDGFLNKILEGVDELDSKNIDIQDVSEEFVDMEARLKNKKQLEAKYQELLGKANNMDDILRIEKEISYIREDIESTEGRLKYLSNQVSYSTLTIHYYEKRSSGFNFGGKLGDALKNGGTGFLWFLIIMVQLWPLWLVGGLVWWFIVWLIRRRKVKGVR
ncbi:MAG TPA: DUF4349 domain-containing protein [Bacteroidia bacterium]|nr:DUF4349 domain-containing protein [Bacteroidia bacterium]